MERVKKICEEVKSAGGRAFLVGGIVRDKFLGLDSKDIDLEVFGIEPEALKTIIEKFGNIIGYFVLYCRRSKFFKSKQSKMEENCC